MSAASQGGALNNMAASWLASAKGFIGCAILGITIGEIASAFWTAHWLTRPGVLFCAGLGWFGVATLRFFAWCVRRRVKLHKASLPDPGPVEMWKAWRLELAHVRNLKRQWPAFCQAHKILGFGKVVPRLRQIRCTVDGDISALVHPGPLHVPKGVNALRAAKESAQQSFGLDHFGVTEEGVGHARLTFLWTNEFERNLPIQNLPTAPKGRIAYGMHRNGSVASLDPNKSILCAGVQGSGKSSLVWTIIAHWLRVGEWVDLYVIDPKGGQEWGWLLRMATITGCRVKVKGFAKDEKGALKLLDEALERVRARQLENGEIDLEDWSQSPVRQVIPTEAEPRIVIVSDELLHLRGALKDTAAKPSPFGQFISISRSAAGLVIAVTQDATKETVGMVRDLFGQRIALRTASASMTNMVLADGAEASGATCSAIPESTPGIGFAYDEDHHGFAEVRIAHVTDDDIRNDIQYGRPPAGMLTATGVAETYYNYRFYTSDMQPLRCGITNNFDRRYPEYRRAYEKERLAIEAGHLDPSKALHQWFAHHDPSKIIVTEAKDWTDAKAKESALIDTGVWRGNHQENMHSPIRNMPPPPEPEGRKHRRAEQAAPVVPINRRRARNHPQSPSQPQPVRNRRRSA